MNQGGVVAMKVTNHALRLSEGTPFFLLILKSLSLGSSSMNWVLLEDQF